MFRYWDPQSGTAEDGVATPDLRMGGSSTVVMSDYHICKYDAIHGVLICVGDDSDVLVVGKHMCRATLPLPHGLHWLDCYVFAGTSTFLVLAPEQLVCLDYGPYGCGGADNSVLSAGKDGSSSSRKGDRFTCLHVPQGLTVGAVGRRDGTVSYFRMTEASAGSGGRPRLAWTTREVHALGMCRPFTKGGPAPADAVAACEQADGKFFSAGSVLSIGSYPENPDAFIAVVAGVPGVCKWYLGENRLSCFFDAKPVAGLPDGRLAACSLTPGGNYVAAVTMHSTMVLLWSEKKKRSDKTCELYWAVNLATVAPTGAPLPSDPFEFNEYGVGFHMARTALGDGFHAKNDKHSHMYMLVYGHSQITEVVVRLDDREVIRKDPIIAHLNAHTGRSGLKPTSGEATSGRTPAAGTADTVDDYFQVFHVEPCVLSNYWNSGLTDVDLEALFVTSADGLRPILVKRNRHTGGVDSIREVRELSAAVPWHPRALLMRLPDSHMRTLAKEVERGNPKSTWETLLRGGDTLLRHASASEEDTTDKAAALWKQSMIATVTDMAEAVMLTPQSNEVSLLPRHAVRNCAPWTSIAHGQDVSTLLLEVALPALGTCFLATEVVLRVYTTEEMVMVMKIDVRRNSGALLFTLSRSSFPHLDRSSDDGAPARMATHASVVGLRLGFAPSSSADGSVTLHANGKSLLLVLADQSVALVDLGGRTNAEGAPCMVHLPAGLLPGSARIRCADVAWRAGERGSVADPYLIILFSEGKGFLVWSLRKMRMVSYTHPTYVVNATRMQLTALSPCPPPNLSGDITDFEVVVKAGERLGSTQAGSCGGVLHCVDAVGCQLLSLDLGVGLANDGGGWCYRRSSQDRGRADEEGVWTPVPASGIGGAVLSVPIILRVRVEGSEVRWGVTHGSAGAEEPVTLPHTAPLHGSIVDVQVCGEWTLGSAQLSYDTPAGEMRSYLLTPSQQSGSAGCVSVPEPTVAFVTATEITCMELGAFFSDSGSGGGGGTAPTSSGTVCKLDATRQLEHISAFHGRGALIVVTRDANGWRWVTILDSRTAQPRMSPHATLEFAGEECVQVLCVEVEGILHLYLLGPSNGIVGHFYVETSLDPRTGSSIRPRSAFTGRSYRPLPSTFRGYGKYLPPQPTLKQETGFFKRLMTLPWEDIALKLESQTLIEVKGGSATAPPPMPTTTDHTPRPTAQLPGTSPATIRDHSPTPTAVAAHQAPPAPTQDAEASALFRKPPAERAVTAPAAAPPAADSEPVGGRYAQLKAIAERENVTLNEARRMMSENVRKLQERGDRLGELQNRSEELSQNALRFEDLARQLKEKQRSSWL